MIDRISLAAVLFAVLVSGLYAAPTPIILDMQGRSEAVLDSLIALQAQSVQAQTPQAMIEVIDQLAAPLSEMVRMDVHVDRLSQQQGNPDDKEHWATLLSNMRQIGIALESINVELERFADDDGVREAYDQLEETLKQAYLEEANK